MLPWPNDVYTPKKKYIDDIAVDDLSIGFDFPHRPVAALENDVFLFGNDNAYYYGLIENAENPRDPIVVSIDHDNESDMQIETYLSIWLSMLNRMKLKKAPNK